jgi:hypothetical protein
MQQRVFFLLLAVVLVSCVGHEPDFARSLAVRSPADLVLINGKIVTVDPKFAIHRTLAIKDGHFAAVGTEREARLWTGPGTRVVNLGGFPTALGVYSLSGGWAQANRLYG